MTKLPRSPEDMEALGWLDAADEARTQNELRSADISRLNRERYEEWLARQKAKSKARKRKS